jgi:glycosyltransferase involved in cell wall biosynthesis
MKICFLVGDLNRFGGIERVSTMVANGLAERNYDVSILSIENGESPFFDLDDNIDIDSLSKSNSKFIYRLPKIVSGIRKYTKENNVDILVTVDTFSVIFTIPALIGLNVKNFAWEHFDFNNNFNKKSRHIFRKLAARYCTKIIVLTEKDKKNWIRSTNHKNQIVSIPNPNSFDCGFNINDVDKNTKVVLAVGRLSHLKGFDMLLDAWSKVMKEVPDWYLKIVGDGEEMTHLDHIIKEKNIENVELVGSVHDVKPYYEEAEIFCLSSRLEGFGMVLLEAFEFGLPIVSFNCEVGPAEVLDGTESILVPPNNTSELATALVKLINDKSLRKHIGARTKHKSKLYSKNNIVDEWEKQLSSSIGE